MQYNLITALAVALGATQVAAYSHGQRDISGGKAIRWQQLAQGVFTGVPEEKWDDKVHKRGNAEWDLEELSARSATSSSVQDRSAELTERNLPGFCQAVPSCTKTGSNHILPGINIWVELAVVASNKAGQDLFDFLAQDFLAADAGGVAFAGRVSGQIDLNTKIECSTDDSQSDAIGSVLNTAAAQTPDAADVAILVNGPSGSWTINAAAGAKNSQVSSSC